MNKRAKIILIGTTAAGVAGAAYYFLVARKNQQSTVQAQQEIQTGIATANSSTGRSLTVDDLKRKQWKNAAGNSIPAGYLTSFDPNTGVVGHKEPAWTGILLDPKTISWHNAAGQADIWKSLDGFPRLLASPRQILD